MTDLHDRFTTWLVEGADGDPTRDVAVHASVCAECLRSASAMDALAAIDPGLAGAPPPIAAPRAGWVPSPSIRAFAGTLAAVSLVAILALGVVNALRPASTEPVGVIGSASPAGEVLGDRRGRETASPSTEEAAPSERESPSSEASASAVATPAGPPLLPPVAPAPPPAVATFGPTPRATPAPTPNPTPRATPAPTPAPTPPPTPPPTPQPTPIPTPTPEPTTSPSPSPTPSAAPG